MDETSDRAASSLLGEDLARQLGLEGQELTDREVQALAGTLERTADLAESVADGDASALADLLDEPFLRRHTDFESFEAFLSASPWDEEDVGAAFAGRERDGPDGDAPAVRNSVFVERTTAFDRPAGLIQGAIIDRCRRRLNSL